MRMQIGLADLFLMRIYLRMPTVQPDAPPAPRKRGRPKTGITRIKISVSIPTQLAKTAKKKAHQKKESLSQYVARAIQNLTLEP
jgi:hypothetical protein